MQNTNMTKLNELNERFLRLTSRIVVLSSILENNCGNGISSIRKIYHLHILLSAIFENNCCSYVLHLHFVFFRVQCAPR